MGRLSEAHLGDTPHEFAGATYDAPRDNARLSNQLRAVRYVMLDGKWHTLAEIAQRVGGSEAGISARLRDLRKLGHKIAKEYVEFGLWRYRLIS